MSGSPTVVHLGDDSVSFLVVSDGGMPVVAHWGRALGPDPLDPACLERPVPHAGLDADAPVGLVAEAGGGWFGRPGIEGGRQGRDFAPRFRLVGTETETGPEMAIGEGSAPRGVRFELVDDVAELGLVIEVALNPGPVLAARATVTNRGAEPYELTALRLSVPVGDAALEAMTLGGRWGFELAEHRADWERSAVVVENRRGKTSHERVGAMLVGSPGFADERGQVWATHLAWSGNYELMADSVTDGRRVIMAGELLGPAEVVLGEGDRYATPWLHLAYSDAGTNPISRAFHRHHRAGRNDRVRPVQLNTWEAVYFDHDLDRLGELAETAAKCGIERFVLDDGWFGARRDDRAGLGDWWVSPDVWPSGLGPLVDRVTGLGMEFGLWVEPEMVNPDSDLHRRHPDWVLADRRYPPVLGRNQLVLDLGRDEVRRYLFDAIDRLLTDHDIRYLKWDHNRDLVAPASGRDDPGRPAGVSGVHAHTLGVYELLDRIRAAHPGVDIESCASGGGRIDLAILARTDRVWASDSIDALDRLAIQRGFSLLFPPEVMGTHIGSPVAHLTGRRHDLPFRAASALFGWLGVEWNLLDATVEERARLTTAIETHKRFRPLLHGGDVLRVDHPDPTVDVHGVVAADRSEAIVAVSRLRSGPSQHTAAVVVAGLDPDRRYRIVPIDVDGSGLTGPVGRTAGAKRQPRWLDGELVMTGRQLGAVGFRAPVLAPETSFVVHLDGR